MVTTETLSKAIEYGMLDLDNLQKLINMKERQVYLEKHQNKVWRGENGYWYTQIGSGSDRKMLKRRTYEALENDIVSYYRHDEATVEFCFQQWLDEKVNWGELKKSTRDRYIRDYERYMLPIGKAKIRYIDEIALEGFVKGTIHKLKLTPKAWSNFRTILNGIWKYAKKNQYTTLSISSFMGDFTISKNALQRKVYSDEEQVFTDDELELIEQYCKNDSDNVLSQAILLGLQTGMRAGEIVTLRYEDVHKDILRIRRTETNYKDDGGKYIYEVEEFTKGAVGYREFVLTDDARATIELLHSLSGKGYLVRKNGKRVKMNSLTQKLYSICDAIGIPRRSMHKLRKTYGTKLLNASVPDPLIKNQMGHTMIDTTRNYYWYRNTTIQEDKTLLESIFSKQE